MSGAARFHEPSVGAMDDWYTPPEIFDALGLTFDLDPCSPGRGHWVPIRKIYTAVTAWSSRGAASSSAILHLASVSAMCRGSGSSWCTEMGLRSFGPIRRPAGFTTGPSNRNNAVSARQDQVRPTDGCVGKAPGHGVVLLGMGEIANAALERCGLGLFVRRFVRKNHD